MHRSTRPAVGIAILMAASPKFSTAEQPQHEVTPQERRERALAGQAEPPASRLPEPSGMTPAPRTAPKSEPDEWAASIDLLPNGGWKYLGWASPDHQGMLFASSHNITPSGSIVTGWFRWEYMLAQSDTYSSSFHSTVAREEIDCSRQAMRAVAAAYYLQNNLEGSGPSFTADQKTLLWTPAIPGTVGEFMVSWACSKLKRTGQ